LRGGTAGPKDEPVVGIFLRGRVADAKSMSDNRASRSRDAVADLFLASVGALASRVGGKGCLDAAGGVGAGESMTGGGPSKSRSMSISGNPASPASVGSLGSSKTASIWISGNSSRGSVTMLQAISQCFHKQLSCTGLLWTLSLNLMTQVGVEAVPHSFPENIAGGYGGKHRKTWEKD